MRRLMRRKDRVALGVAAGLLAAAVAQELRKPAADRHWHGRLAGTVPYDFRPPTPARVRRALWDPQDPRLFTSHVFGVGWSLNLARLVALARRRAT